MTEQEWLDSSDPARMLHVVTGKAEGPHAGGVITPRKLRLWGCACCRAMPPTRDAEIIANEKAFIAHVEAMADVGTNATRPPGRMRMAVSFLQYSGLDVATYWARDRWGEEYAPVSAATRAYLLREIVGNPFRPVTLEPGPNECRKCRGKGDRPAGAGAAVVGRPDRVKCQWCRGTGRTPCPWLSTRVRQMAQTIYDDRDFAALPILADALEDAGCPSDVPCPRDCKPAVGGGRVFSVNGWEKGATVRACDCGDGRISSPLLDHLRSPDPHVRGCWALDLILGRE